MFDVKFVIVAVNKVDRTELELFRWTRDLQSGLDRALREGAEFFGKEWLDTVEIVGRPVEAE